MTPTKTIPGQRFNHLTVIALESNPPKDLRAKCRCDCGNTTLVVIGNLKTGHTTSCGCHRIKVLQKGQRNGTHHMTGTAEFQTWQGIKHRCLNKNSPAFHRYGGRGISVCPRWRDSFENFYADMGQRPPHHSIDRIDNDGNYEPKNCRWATMRTQRSNDSRAMLLTYKGETMALSHWAERIGMHQSVLRQRVVKLRWPIEKAIETPARLYRRH